MKVVAVNPLRGVHAVCLKSYYKGYEISIAFDDSCGAMKDLSRADIEVYAGPQYEECVTASLGFAKGHEVLTGSLENLMKVKRRIDRLVKKEDQK